MKKFMMGSIATGVLLTLASCSSDAKTATTTPATEAAAGTEAAATDTAASDAGLSAVQAQAVAISIEGAAAAGVVLDEACFSAVVAKLSDADAQLIVEAGPSGNPKLSAEGESHSAEAAACATIASIDTTAVTG